MFQRIEEEEGRGREEREEREKRAERERQELEKKFQEENQVILLNINVTSININ